MMTLIYSLVFLNIFIFLLTLFLSLKIRHYRNQNIKANKLGLERIESQIKIFEDLSDRTEKECQQLTTLLDKKSLHIQKKIQLAKLYTQKIEEIIQKSLEVTKIFQEKIPYKDLAEKQKTSNYIKAAQKAHAGASIEEISKVIDLPKKEIELIYKINHLSEENSKANIETLNK